ncbi:UNVERIFIED_CONTAM: Endoribonuclease Dicer1 [Sesamum calycinum]|uniref:Endoribonuclease Dicer1 n=1 Tax=Sesamum calycinum TaxID=2727403 RepID=A0AAW2RPD1_9LAMI
MDAEVLSMSMDLLIARSVVTKASLVFKGLVEVRETKLTLLKSFHVRLMCIVLDVDVEPSKTPWEAYLFVPLARGKSADPMNNIADEMLHSSNKCDS